MNKEQMITEFKQRYLRNENVSEKEIAINDHQFFRAVLEEFGSWHKFEKEMGFLQRHLREREKYFLFMMMKERKERFGVEALRHKNIEDEIKEKITEGFGTVKKLTKDILDGWNQERVLFEAHTYFVTGGTAQSLKKERSLLAENISRFFANEEHFYAEYEKRFLIQPLNEVQAEIVEVEPEVEELKEVSPVQNTVGIDLDFLVNIGYMPKEKAVSLKKAYSIPVEEVYKFVSELDSNVSEEKLQQENSLMYLAINRLGGLAAIRQEQKEEERKNA